MVLGLLGLLECYSGMFFCHLENELNRYDDLELDYISLLLTTI